jgi:hypothetical protein
MEEELPDHGEWRSILDFSRAAYYIQSARSVDGMDTLVAPPVENCFCKSLFALLFLATACETLLFMAVNIGGFVIAYSSV